MALWIRGVLICALAQNPKLLLCDEPIASLDPSSSTIIMDHLKSISKELNITCLVNLHQVQVALKYSDRIIGINSGKVVYDNNTDIDVDKINEIYGSHIELGMLSDLERLIDPATRGEPDSPLRRTSKSTHKLAKNGGKELQPKKSPELVRVHDFQIPVLGKVNPYGVYDLTANTGWVSVGTDHDLNNFLIKFLHCDNHTNCAHRYCRAILKEGGERIWSMNRNIHAAIWRLRIM